jgi:mersacidin/lichenicidin family type 2 lantibiotic
MTSTPEPAGEWASKEKPMSVVNIIRAWKDEAYRASLSEAEQAALPPNPAGAIELTETELDNVVGGRSTFYRCWQQSTRNQPYGTCFSPTYLCTVRWCMDGTGRGTGGNCSKIACCQQ